VGSMKQKLATITLAPDAEGAARALIKWCMKRGKLEMLVAAARTTKPAAPELRTFVGLPPHAPPEVRLQGRQLKPLDLALQRAFRYAPLQDLVRRTFHQELDAISLGGNLSN